MPDAALGFLIFCVRKGGSDMEYRAQEVIQYAREEKVKFVRLAFSDVYGRQKNVTIMASELERAFGPDLRTTDLAIDRACVEQFRLLRPQRQHGQCRRPHHPSSPFFQDTPPCLVEHIRRSR